MTSPNRPFSRALAAIFLAALGALILVISFQKQHWDSDILWALKSGEWILERLEVPTTDPFSYTFGGKPWVDFTWGFQVLARLFYDYLGGWTGCANSNIEIMRAFALLRQMLALTPTFS